MSSAACVWCYEICVTFCTASSKESWKGFPTRLLLSMIPSARYLRAAFIVSFEQEPVIMMSGVCGHFSLISAMSGRPTVSGKFKSNKTMS